MMPLQSCLRLPGALAILLVLASCIYTMPQLQVAPGAASAKLRYLAGPVNEAAFTHLYAIDTSPCPARPIERFVTGTGPSALLFTQAQEVSNVQMLGSSAKPEAMIRERLIPADKPFIFTVDGGDVATQYTSGFSCQHGGVFVPRVGGEYEIQFEARRTGPHCGVAVFRLQAGADGAVERIAEPSARMFLPRRDLKDYCRLKI